MNDKPKGRFIPKQRLEIVKYEADISYGTQGRTLDRMTAKNMSLEPDAPLFDKPVRHTVFNQSLKTFFRSLGEGSLAVCDVEEKDRPDSEYGPDRTIVQAYDGNGNAVSKKEGGGNYNRRSLADDLALEAVKRRSIEAQTAIAEVGLWMRDPKSEVYLNDELRTGIISKYWKALDQMLDNYLEEPAPKKPPSGRQKPQNDQETAPKPAQVVNDQTTDDTPLFKNFGEVLTRSSKLNPPVTRAELMKALDIKEGGPAPELNKAWAKAEELSAAKYAAANVGSEETWKNIQRDPQK
jgi:hypothetical protein